MPLATRRKEYLRERDEYHRQLDIALGERNQYLRQRDAPA